MLSRRRPPAKRQFTWRQLAFEVFVVVLGVTLALGANELRQRFVDARRVEAATESIAAEMQQNCDRLERSLAYHRRLQAEVDSLESVGPDILNGDAERVLRALPSWRGYNSAFVTSSAYETARATGALELMPYDRALGLGNYYTFIGFYRETVRDGLGSIMAGGIPSFNQVALVLSITLDLEEELAPGSCEGAQQLGGEPTESASDSPASDS